jgi:hypothetical protein
MGGSSDDEDVQLFAAAAGFDFDEGGYQPTNDVSEEELFAQLRMLEKLRSTPSLAAGAESYWLDLRREASAAGGGFDALMRQYSCAECDTLVVAFAAMGGGGGGVGRHEFVASLSRAGATHCLFVRDPFQLWYLAGTGTDDADRTFAGVVRAIADEVAKVSPRRLATVGASMGGYAAIRAGLALRADSVLAFGPQVFIGTEERAALRLPHSHTFGPRLAKLPAACAALGVAPLSLTAAIEEASRDPAHAQCVIDVHVGARDWGDTREALLLQAAAAQQPHARARCEVHVKVHAHVGFGHAVVRDLRDAGQLGPLLTALLDGGASEGGPQRAPQKLMPSTKQWETR